MRKSVIMTGAVALLGLAACGDQLAVENVDQPDLENVLATMTGVETFISGLGSQLNNPQRGSESVNTQAKIMAEETFATVANFGMAARVANRSFISNELGNDNAASNFNIYNSLQRVSRNAANGLAAYRRLEAQNTLTPTATNRMRAFGYLVLGNSMGFIAMAYDSGAAVLETVQPADIPPLVGYADLGAAAISALDSAEAIATRGMDALPAAWLSQTATVNQADFIRIVRSYRARIRAGIARTPAERAAVNWTAVLADAQNGITSDLVIQINGTTGWGAGFDANQIYVTGGWHQFPMRFAGMADSSGAYQAWAASSNKRAFLVRTLDGRWASGDTRAAQQASTPNNSILPRYIRNRPTGDDVLVADPGESQYDHRRYGATQANTGIAGPYTEMSATEVAMLAAEAHIRLGNPAAAEPLIDISRLRNGLPSVVGVGNGTVPGGAACVPKLPNGNCGSLLEAMKYEKRMETAFTGFMIWFSDSRGWGDLLPNTVVEWPVPYQELQARQKSVYNGTNQFTGPNTYGFTN